jgi:hypothetical protein
VALTRASGGKSRGSQDLAVLGSSLAVLLGITNLDGALAVTRSNDGTAALGGHGSNDNHGEDGENEDRLHFERVMESTTPNEGVAEADERAQEENEFCQGLFLAHMIAFAFRPFATVFAP